MPLVITYPKLQPDADSADVFDEKTNPEALQQPHDNGVSVDCDMRWGFALRRNEDQIRYVKLFLDSSESGRALAPETLAQLERVDKTVISVVTDFLRAITAHIRGILEQEDPYHYDAAGNERWVLTFPAIWLEPTRDSLRRAALDAGVGPEIDFVSEPEAAATYALRSMEGVGFRKGDNFLVCDAGGGTVDLIAYEIRRMQPLEIQESTVGSGGYYGANSLNTSFFALVQKKLGDTVFAKLREKHPTAWESAQENFEILKQRFHAKYQPPFDVPFPGVNIDGIINNGCFELSHQELAEMFRVVIADIEDLIGKQITQANRVGKDITRLLLVGGFGQSERLFNVLTASLDSKIQVYRSPNAITAVARGAVLHGLAEKVVSKGSNICAIGKDLCNLCVLSSRYRVVKLVDITEWLHGLMTTVHQSTSAACSTCCTDVMAF